VMEPEEPSQGASGRYVSEGLAAFIDAYASLSFEKCDAAGIERDENGLPTEPGNARVVEAKCKKEGLKDLDDLRQLSKRIWLGDLFAAKVALRMENAFDSPTFDAGKVGLSVEADKKKGEWKRLAPDEWRLEMERKTWLNSFHFKFSVQTMQNICSTHGVIAALLLTMNIGAFASMTSEEWALYEQGIATERCTHGGIGVDQSLGIDECSKKNRQDTEMWFVLSNHLAFSLLLIVLLFATGLYICVAVSNPSESRPYEADAVVARFSGEFATLQVLFAVSVICSGVGLIQMVQLKTTNWDIVLAVNWMSLVVVLALIFIFAWLYRELKVTKTLIKQLRSDNSKDTEQKANDIAAETLSRQTTSAWVRKSKVQDYTQEGSALQDM